MKLMHARIVPLCLAMAATAAAQDPSPQPSASPDTPPRRQEIVNVEAELPVLPPLTNAATRLPVAVKDLPVSVSVIPRSLMREQDVFVLSDALRNASGVNAATGFGVFDFFTVRGVDSLSGGLVLTDGVPEPESTYYPLYNVRQVEVLKGPGSFLYGGSAMAGAVQIVRKQPSIARFAEGSLSYGRYGTYEATVDGNAASRDGRLALRVNAVRQGTEGFRDIGSGSISGINPVLSWQPSDRTRVSLGFEYVRSNQQPDSGVPFVGESGSALAPVPRTTSYQSPFDGSEQDVYRVRLEAERQLTPRVSLRNRFYYTQLDWDSDGTLVAGVTPFPDGRLYALRTLVMLDDSQKLLGNQLELAASFSTGRIGHELLAGVELSRLQDRFVQDVALLDPLDLLAPVQPANPGPPVTLPAFGLAGDGRAVVIAPYLVDRVSLSRQWQLFLGARFDTLDYEDRALGTDRDDSRLSPLLGVVFSPTSALSLHASAGTSFSPPSTQVVGPREPETSRQAEVGAKLQLLGGRAFVGATAYALEREDIAIPDASGLFKQDGDQRVRGFEFDLSARPSEGLVTYAAYAYTDAELTRFADALATPFGLFVTDRSGNTPAFVPRHLASLWVSKEVARGLAVSAGVRAVSEQFAGEDNRYRIGSYATLDAAVSYSTGRTRCALHLKNLTGTEYETRGFGGISAIPGRPFEALARIDVRLGSR
jgi:TonB-dependent siderophore receptor